MIYSFAHCAFECETTNKAPDAFYCAVGSFEFGTDKEKKVDTLSSTFLSFVFSFECVPMGVLLLSWYRISVSLCMMICSRLIK